MFRMIEAAAACVRHSAPKRPRMSKVIIMYVSISVCLISRWKKNDKIDYILKPQFGQMKNI